MAPPVWVFFFYVEMRKHEPYGKKKKKEPPWFQVSSIDVLASPFHCQTKDSCTQLLLHMPDVAKRTDA